MTAGRRFLIPRPGRAEPNNALALRGFLRDDHTCVYCGATGLPLELNHRRPKAHYAASSPAAKVNAPSNLVTACTDCNSAKGPQNVAGFAAMLRGRGVARRAVASMLRQVRRQRRRRLP